MPRDSQRKKMREIKRLKWEKENYRMNREGQTDAKKDRQRNK